ncbi:MAG: pyridoxamine 5'-phosphate oxidase [Candidatus Limnocylindria bacterium]
MPIDPADLDPDPIRQLSIWLADADAAGLTLPTAFALATADGDGVPSVRMVLLRALDDAGLRFYTNVKSRKGRDAAVNPRGAAAFWWPQLERQARVAGPMRALERSASEAYWRTRPRGSQLSASVSRQGQETGSRAELEAAVVELAERHPDHVPLPEDWGGYLLTPELVEFWESRADRLHDRVEYLRDAAGTWRRRRLQP